MKKLLIQMVGIILTVTMTMSSTVNTLAASRKRYIKEIRLCYAESYEEAVESMGDDYTVLDHSLTEGSYSDEINGTQDVWVGYTTTAKATEAVTDIAAMNMYGDFDENGYEDIVEGFREQVQDELSALKAMIAEYRKNYWIETGADKVGKAHICYNLLTYYLDDDCMESGKPMSLADVFLQEGLCDNEHLTDILVQGNARMVMNVENILASAQNTGSTSWLKTLQKTTYKTMEKQYKLTYGSSEAAARKITQDYVEDFAMLQAKWEELYNGLKAFDESGLDENSTEEEIDAASGTGDTYLSATTYITIGIALKKLEYQGATLFDYFFVTPQTVFENQQDYYPILASLSVGEKGALYASDLSTLIQNGLSDGVDWVKQAEELEELEEDPVKVAVIKATIADKEDEMEIEFVQPTTDDDPRLAETQVDGKITVKDQDLEGLYEAAPTSVFIGVNRDFYKEGVALTGDAVDRMIETGTTPGDSGDGKTSIWTSKTIALTVAASVALTGAVASFVIAARYAAPYITKLKEAYNFGGKLDLAAWGGFGGVFKEAQRIENGIEFCGGYYKLLRDTDVIKEIRASSGSEAIKAIQKSGTAGKAERVKLLGDGKEIVKNNMRIKLIGIGLSVLFIALTIWDIISIVDQINKNKKQQEDAETTEYIYDREIPPLMVWARNTEEDDGEGNISTVTDYLYYEVVPTVTEEDADIYARTQKQWVALYTSTDHACGDPILADSLVVQPGGGTPDNCNGAVHLFGDTRLTALNLHDASELQLVENDGNSGFGLFYKGDPYWQEGIKGSVFSDNPLSVSLAAGGLLAVCGAATIWVARRKKKTV